MSLFKKKKQLGDYGTAYMFHQHFDIRQIQPVLGHNSFLRWANSLKTKLNIVKTKPSGPARSARTPEDIARVKIMAVPRSPSLSTKRHSQELNMYRETVRRILQLNLKFIHP